MKISPINLQQWIDDNRDKLKPPVGNQVIWDDEDYIVMVVGGPNKRKDFHVNSGAELFYQLEGDITLKIIEDKKVKNIEIKQGELYLLQNQIPHSPRRPKDTVGLVIETKRRQEELDGFQWYCDHCDHKLFEIFVHIDDIVKQLPEIFDKFYSDEILKTCDKCCRRFEL